jgi:succinate dehydrogenase flavin-adding protein (antitoxin of CptAB toxin-antitoxin module)
MFPQGLSRMPRPDASHSMAVNVHTMRHIRFYADIVDRLSCTGVFTSLSYVPGHGPTGIGFEGQGLGMRTLTGIYYSIITATNTGYGDIAPHGFSRVFAAAEAVLSLLIFAVFIGKLVSRKQNIAIRHMHRTSFEGSFHDVREDLHIVRKDFNRVMEMVRDDQEITPRKWQSLRVAFLQVGGILREVPTFYDAENHMYRIDVRRERLLIEAFHRTLEKLDAMFAVFDEHNVSLVAQEKAVAELRELLNAFDDGLTRWKQEALRNPGNLFEELLSIVDRIRARLAGVYPGDK